MKFFWILQLRHLIHDSIDDIYWIWWTNNMQEPKRQNNIRASKVSLQIKCNNNQKKKDRPLFDINLFIVAFENHSAVAPCRSFGNLRSKFASNPLACKSFISGKYGNRCSKCPTATFSIWFPLKTYAPYLCDHHGGKYENIK